jgi:hypothetical protein
MDDVPDPIGQPIWLFGPWVASQAPTPQSAPHVSPLSATWQFGADFALRLFQL